MNLQGNASSVILVPQINLVFVFVLFRNQFLTSRSVSDELLYKSYAKTLKNLLFKARSIYYKNLLDGCINSTKNVWKCLNSLTSSKCRSEEHTSELQSLAYLVCRLLLEKKKKNIT